MHSRLFHITDQYLTVVKAKQRQSRIYTNAILRLLALTVSIPKRIKSAQFRIILNGYKNVT